MATRRGAGLASSTRNTAVRARATRPGRGRTAGDGPARHGGACRAAGAVGTANRHGPRIHALIWEPLAPPAPADSAGPAGQPPAGGPGTAVLETSADALIETLSTLAARQREHRTHTADRLTHVLDSALLPANLTDMALYYRAKAHRDLGRSTASRQGMQQVAAGTTRLAPAEASSTLPALAATSPPPWPPPRTSAGPDASTASSAESGEERGPNASPCRR